MKEIEKKLIIDNGYKQIYQTFYDFNGKFGNVITMQQSENVDAIVFLPITKDKQIIYLDEFRFGPNKRVISFPTGSIDKGEKPEDAVKRELLEETGYKCEKVIQLGKYIHNNYIYGTVYLFLALDCKKEGKQNLLDLEDIKVIKTSFEDFENMIENNKVQCSLSETAYYRAKKLTNNFKDI